MQEFFEDSNCATGYVVRSAGRSGQAEEGLRKEDCPGEAEEQLALACFEGVGEDSADESEEEWERPEPGG